MQPCEAAQALNALKITSVIRWEVKTLPAATAALSEGASREPSSINTSTGSRQPWFSGMLLSTRQRRQ